VCNLVAVLLALARGATELLERLQEERLDVVRLEPLGVSSFHFLAHLATRLASIASCEVALSRSF